MDLVYDSFSSDFLKRHVHFNSFMLEVHQRIYELRNRSSVAGNSNFSSSSNSSSHDQIQRIAREISLSMFSADVDDYV